MLKKNPKEKKVIIEWMEKIRKSYQGEVFTTLSTYAEQKKAIAIAIEETENALVILRFFSPTSLIPEIPSYFDRMGHTALPTNHLFIFESKYPNLINEIDEERQFQWPIREKDIFIFKTIGLDQANDILTKQKRTAFEDLLFSSIHLFSRAIVSKEFQDKLVFTLVSLETLLLKDTLEPIQTMLGLRLSFIPDLKVEQRKEIIRLIKDAYVFRSSFIHHGKKSEDIQLLQNLQRVTWDTLRIALINKNRFATQKEFIDFIENRILS